MNKEELMVKNYLTEKKISIIDLSRWGLQIDFEDGCSVYIDAKSDGELDVIFLDEKGEEISL